MYDFKTLHVKNHKRERKCTKLQLNYLQRSLKLSYFRMNFTALLKCVKIVRKQ